MKTITWLKIKFAVGVATTALLFGGAIPMMMAQPKTNPAKSTAELPASDDTLIVPGQSVGKVRKGMSAEQVETALGKPDRKSGRNEGIWEYTRFGFAVFTTPAGVPVVMCGDSSGADSALAKTFKARTKENIGMGSTRAEILKAFGQPTTTEQSPINGEILEYKTIGLRFTLSGGKVHHLIVDFRNTK
jgi:outer membrane protein assembly factor BamE (lipoprotein component of BamABCDE complex)